ncbi:DUF3304 domain-containing protein [Variovorax boronicumulans]|uniref:DUF3304 domain-containing protein n=1 Tax=Variovorax boronicumulans TaxID=436515 RepID=UPI00339754FB
MSVQSMPAASFGKPSFNRMAKGAATQLYRWLAALAILTAGMGLAACKPVTAKPLTVGITGYTFTSEGIQEYYVNGVRGSNLPPYGGGGSTSCCVPLPAKWTPDLTVKVDWITGHWTVPMEQIMAMDISDAIKCCLARRTLSKVVPVERYEVAALVQVFFLPEDEIKVWVYDPGPQNPSHPSRMGYPKKPDTTE